LPSDPGRAGLIVAGKFRLDAMIGRGGMGSVWRATHLGLGHQLAIKLIGREFVRSAEALRRFDAEARAAARLQSRHVVQVFDNGALEDGTPYIVMELLAGENLAQRIARLGPLALGNALNVLGQACKALSRAHAAGIVHRDIKPDNIFLSRTPDDDAEIVKVLDFGVAKMTDGAVPGSATGTGTLLGTPLFMSPEQVRGSRDIDFRTDLYSLGLVAFTMLTGKLARSDESMGQLVLKICVEPLPSLVEAAPWLPPALEGWFQRACARLPAERHPSAEAFLETFRAAAGDRAPEAGPPFLPQTPPVVSGVSALTPGPSVHPSVLMQQRSVSVPAGVRPRHVTALVFGALASVALAAAVIGLVATRRYGFPSARDKPLASASLGGADAALADAPTAPPASEVTLAPVVALGDASTAPSASLLPAAAPSSTPGPHERVVSVTLGTNGAALAPASKECVPPCRRGYVCNLQGQCVTACNPPCAQGERCTPEGACVPAGQPGVNAVDCVPRCRTGYACDGQGHCVPRP
jgi:serine/threonine-protein kinase